MRTIEMVSDYRQRRKTARLIGIIFLVCVLCCQYTAAVAEGDIGEYVRIGRFTHAYLSPAEDAEDMGVFLRVGNAKIYDKSEDAYGNVWYELVYLYDEGLLNADVCSETLSEERLVYVKESETIEASGQSELINNAIIRLGQQYDGIPYASAFSEDLLSAKDAPVLNLSMLDSHNIKVYPTSRNKTVGENADFSDALLMLKTEYGVSQIFCPSFTVSDTKASTLAYPMYHCSISNMPVGNTWLTYTNIALLSDSGLFDDSKIVRGIEFILENSPPYAEYVSWPANYTEASRTAASHALWMYLKDYAGMDSQEDIFLNITPYDNSAFNADYYAYMYWLYEGAARSYAGDEYVETTDMSVAVITAQNGRKTPLFVLVNNEPVQTINEEPPLDDEKDDESDVPQENAVVKQGLGTIAASVVSENGDKIRGAGITVTRLDEWSAAKNAQTDKRGSVEFDGLQEGTYQVALTSVPRGYELKNWSKIVRVHPNEDTSINIILGNPINDFCVLVKDKDTGAFVSGLSVALYTGKGKTPICTVETDENGMAQFSDIEPGEYQIGAMVDEKIFAEPERIKVNVPMDDNILELSVRPHKVSVNIFARDSAYYDGNLKKPVTTSGDATLTGCEYAIIAHADIVNPEGKTVYKAGDVVKNHIVVDNKNLTATVSGLWPGEYTVVEVGTSQGYQRAQNAVFGLGGNERYDAKTHTYDVVMLHAVKQGQFTISFVDEDGAAKAGEVFEIFLTSDKTYKNSPVENCEKIKITTDGTAVSKKLPYGEYTIMQSKGKNKLEKHVVITGEEDGGMVPTIDMGASKVVSELLVSVVDENHTQVKVQGGRFALKKDGQKIAEIVLTSDGKGVAPILLEPGEYTLTQEKTLPGYRQQRVPIAFEIASSDNTSVIGVHMVDVKNTRETRIANIHLVAYTLTGFGKVVSDNGYELNLPEYTRKDIDGGAMFDIYADETIYDSDGSILYGRGDQVLTTVIGGNGVGGTGPLVFGKYYIKQSGSLAEYTYDSAERRFEIDSDSTQSVEMWFEMNYFETDIIVTKVKELLVSSTDGYGTSVQRLEYGPGDGYVIGLYNSSDIVIDKAVLPKDSLISTIKIGPTGGASIQGKLPRGGYYLREIEAPDGYLVSDERVQFSVSPRLFESRIHIDAPMAEVGRLCGGEVSIKVVDSKTRGGVGGVLVELMDGTQRVINRQYTDDGGYIGTMYLAPGTYSCKVALAAEGYAAGEVSDAFTIDTSESETKEIVLDINPVTISIHQIDENELPLSGVRYGVYDDNGAVVLSGETDAHGDVQLTQLMYGEYVIQVSQHAPGYVSNVSKIKVHVDGSFMNTEDCNITVQSWPNYIVMYVKSEDDAPIVGAEFALLNNAGETYQSSTSDQWGRILFSAIPDGSYTIVQKAGADGFLKTNRVQAIYVADGEVISDAADDFVNVVKGTEFTVVDVNGNPVAGMMFALINRDDNTVAEVSKSGENGVVVFRAYDEGEYVLQQSEHFSGFVDAEPVDIVVSDAGLSADAYKIVAIQDYYLIDCVDSHGRAKAGITFVLKLKDGLSIAEATSDENGRVTFTDLDRGEYEVGLLHKPDTYSGEDYTDAFVVDENYNVDTPSIYRIVDEGEGLYGELSGRHVALNGRVLLEGSIVIAIIAALYIALVYVGRRRRRIDVLVRSKKK